jgi:acyl-CoA dehydrogenase
MIDFSLTDEQKALRELAHAFAEKEIRPVAWDYDRESTWPQAIMEKAWEVGLMNPQIPAEYGGAGASSTDGVLIEEELGWGCSGIGTSISCNGLASAPVLLGGSEQVKKTYLGMLTEAPKLASFCLTEPGAGSDVSGMRTRAVKQGDKYLINGSKTFITAGSPISSEPACFAAARASRSLQGGDGSFARPHIGTTVPVTVDYRRG